jgi:hypothetical protein
MSKGKIAIPISLHDVSESSFERDQKLLEKLRSAGIEQVALMVIPASSGDSGRRKAFGEWLLEEVSSGGELFCHGWRHRADLAAERSRVGKIQNRLTNGEAEFAGLDRKAGRQLLLQALQQYNQLQCGIPFGFTPPTWYAPDWLEEEAYRFGVTVYEKRLSISRNGRSRFSFPLSFFAGNDHRFRLSVETARKMLIFNRGFLRLALHPIDFSTEERRRMVFQLLEELQKKNRPASYAELLF